MTETPITIVINKISVEAKTRKLSARWTFVDDSLVRVSEVRQVEDLTFSIYYAPGVREWIDQFGYKAKFNSDSNNPELYNVIFIKAADAAHFKLVWC